MAAVDASAYRSWGRFPAARPAEAYLAQRDMPFPQTVRRGLSYLPFGNGRSYGDSCLNDGGVLIDCRSLNRILSFDAKTGLLRCEAGVLLADILKLGVPQGWFLPVTPGTRFVTVGGAIANDVHGKNQNSAGTFGCHVRQFELVRSDGSRRVCSAKKNPDWFASTIGGLGLTGLVMWAEIQLKPVAGPAIDQETTRFANLKEFFEISADAGEGPEYTVSWLDSLASGEAFGRGLFMAGKHASGDTIASTPTKEIAFPLSPSFPLLNRATLRVFNAFYYRKQLRSTTRNTVPYEPFFYPLDRIRNWHRAYGPKGLLQHQCVVPMDVAEAAVTELLERSARAGAGSFLTVLKEFGCVRSPGLMSFPRAGLTLTLDFANRGERTLALLDQLDNVVIEAGGAVNPSKDGRMSARAFQAFFPQWRELSAFVDPRISSSFWRRVTECG